MSKNAPSLTNVTKVVDWRVWKAATVAADAPPIVPGGSPIKAGDVIYAVTNTFEADKNKVSFITPSPVALALDISIKAAKEADAIRGRLVWKKTDAAPGQNFAEPASLPDLYAMFEQSMIAVTFA